jgi:hypothetical protein
MYLEENVSPSVIAYIQSISETLNTLRPSSTADKRRIEIAKSHLKEVRKHVIKLEEKVFSLEEVNSSIEERKEDSKFVKEKEK